MNHATLFTSLALAAVVSSLAGCDVESSAPTSADDLDALGEVTQDLRRRNPLVLQDTATSRDAYRKAARGWMTWALGQPWSTGPVTDTTGAQCGLDQHGSIFYLAGTESGDVTRSCEVPPGKQLFFPLRNWWVIPPATAVDTPEEYANYLAFIDQWFPQDRLEVCELTLRVDGQEVLPSFEALEEELWLELRDPFPLYLYPVDNFSGSPGGMMPKSVVTGHWALLAPLAPGDHVVELGGKQCDIAGDGSVYFETSATYNIHVPQVSLPGGH